MNHFLCLLTACQAILIGPAWPGEAPKWETGANHDPVVWAKPFINGPLQCLFLSPAPLQADIVELARQMDMDWRHIDSEWQTRSRRAAARAGDRDAKRTRLFQEQLRAELDRPLDVIVAGGFRWDDLTREHEFRILQKVADGCGLVFLHHEGGHNDTIQSLMKLLGQFPAAPAPGHGIPFPALPGWDHFPSEEAALKRLVNAGNFKKGRIAFLNFGKSSHSHLLAPALENTAQPPPIHFDYYLGLVCKVMLWSARKTYPLRISPKVKLLKKSGAAHSNGWTLGASYRGRLPAENRVVYILRNASGVSWQREFRNLHNLADVTVRAPDYVDDGRFGVFDIRVFQETESVAWASVLLPVKSALGVQSFAVEPKGRFRTGDRAVARMQFSQPTTDATTCKLLATDSLGRTLLKKLARFEKGQAEARIEFRIPAMLGGLLNVRLTCRTPSSFRVTRQAWVPVQSKAPKQEFLLWALAEPARGFHEARMLRTLYKLGLGAVVTERTGDEALLFARSNLDRVIRVSNYELGQVNGDQKGTRSFFTAPKYLDAEEYRLKQKLKKFSLLPSRTVALGEWSARDRSPLAVWEGPQARAAWQKYLRVVYQDSFRYLESDWGREFKDWQAVPIPEPWSPAAVQSAPLLRILYQGFKEDVVRGFHQWVLDIVEKEAPDARGGIGLPELSQLSIRPDWWRFIHTFHHVALPQDKVAMELARCVRKPKTALLMKFRPSPDRSIARARLAPWAALLNGFQGIRWGDLAEEEGTTGLLFQNDLRPQDDFRALAEEVANIRQGVGRLLTGSLRLNAGLGLLYSPESYVLGQFTKGPSRHSNALRAFMKLLERMGLQYDVIPEEELSLPRIRQLGIRTLFLPSISIMKPRTAEVIQDFVENEGVVVADFQPGTRDRLGRDRFRGLLDGVFGVRGTESSEYASGALSLSADRLREWVDLLKQRNLNSIRHIAPRLPEFPAAGTLQASRAILSGSGQALGAVDGMPVLNVHRVHKGLALLLNFALEEPFAESSGFMDLVSAFTQTARDYPFQLSHNAPTGASEIVAYRDGKDFYLGVLAEPGIKSPGKAIRIELPQSVFVYNCRTGQYLGRRKHLSVPLKPGRADIYALLAEPSPRFVLEAPRQAPSGKGVTVHLRVSGSTSHRHVFHFQVKGPDGRTYRHYSGLRQLTGDPVDFEIPFAESDLSGRWQVNVRDAATGSKGTLSFLRTSALKQE